MRVNVVCAHPGQLIIAIWAAEKMAGNCVLLSGMSSSVLLYDGKNYVITTCTLRTHYLIVFTKSTTIISRFLFHLLKKS
jgi:hypothetical protein